MKTGEVKYYLNVAVFAKHKELNAATLRNKFSRTKENYITVNEYLLRKEIIIVK